jgi:DNA-binding Lrp family transcriptional regulator
VEVEVISETASQIESAKREFAATPEIQQCYYVTGEALSYLRRHEQDQGRAHGAGFSLPSRFLAHDTA